MLDSNPFRSTSVSRVAEFFGGSRRAIYLIVWGTWLASFSLLAAFPLVARSQSAGVTAVVISPTLVGSVAVGNLRLNHGTVTLQNDSLTVSALIARDGRFELPFVPVGEYRAVVAAGDVKCVTFLRIPIASTMRTDIGLLSCNRWSIEASAP